MCTLRNSSQVLEGNQKILNLGESGEDIKKIVEFIFGNNVNLSV